MAVVASREFEGFVVSTMPVECHKIWITAADGQEIEEIECHCSEEEAFRIGEDLGREHMEAQAAAQDGEEN